MTICIGLLASDGITIAADSQESDQYFKRSQQKIVTYSGPVKAGETSPDMACALTGSGSAGYLDSFFYDALQGIPADATSSDLEQFFKSKLYGFHEKHLFPLSASPTCPAMDVLIGAYSHWKTSLFVSSGSALRQAFPFTAVGIGAHFAMGMINDMPGQLYDLAHAELIAAYVVAVTKERIEGCGKYTHIVSLHNPSIVYDPGGGSHLVKPVQPLTRVPWQKIQKWEQSFDNRWTTKQTELILQLLKEELQDCH